ncbi:Uma2 family endonuclease [Actinopolymorpha sp. B17G11]|uniref:Uma2 family endonuclease n=1 Tax=unclassified Actinopolymorpha TaxID=2627063 RepID=UPI0032D96C15
MERGCPVTQPAFAVDSWPDFWTEDDLAALPDDGHRYEIIDGSLVVSPPPTSRHQSIVGNILAVLRAAAPAGWRVLHEVGLRVPGGNFIADGAALRPGADLDLVWQDPSAVGLVVEVASDSTQDLDDGSKAIKYARAGIPAYWRVARDGSIKVGKIVRPGEYGLVTKVEVGQVWEATVPFPVMLDPQVIGA